MIRFSIAAITLCIVIANTSARDPIQQPFHETSIWNMPIGTEAVYVSANIIESQQNRMTVDEDVLLLDPNAPMTRVYRHSAGWSRTKSRCNAEDEVQFRIPLAADFVYSPETWDGLTSNASTAALMPDGRSLRQFHPFARCTAGEPATNQYIYPTVDLYGDGIEGAHGGSGLSSIGGTIRLGELVPGGSIPHVMKMNLFNINYYYRTDEADGKAGYRWPAVQSDSYAPELYSGSNPALQMGSLMALLPEIDLSEMETEPGRIVATAFINYGAYIVDDTAWDVYALCTEHSPRGTVIDEFREAWGFDMSQSGDSPWTRDIRRIITNLHIVENNAAERVGGGGEPLVPMAESLEEPTRVSNFESHEE